MRYNLFSFKVCCIQYKAKSSSIHACFTKLFFRDIIWTSTKTALTKLLVPVGNYAWRSLSCIFSVANILSTEYQKKHHHFEQLLGSFLNKIYPLYQCRHKMQNLFRWTLRNDFPRPCLMVDIYRKKIPPFYYI